MGRFINADAFASTGQGILGCNMFAYCGNNAVNEADPTGKIIIDIFLYFIQSETNKALDENEATTTRNKLIYDQNDETISRFQFGCWSASWNACEAIAIHNAKCILGIETTLSATINHCYECGNILYGYWGTNPYKIGTILSEENINYTEVELDNLSDPGLYIVSYWTGNKYASPIHTVAIVYDGSTYKTYNNNGLSYKSPFTYASDFVTGYRITDYGGCN